MNSIHRIKIFALGLLMVMALGAKEPLKAQPGARISFETFYQELSPYGRWTTNPQFGTVWTPYVSNDFQPYSTNGYWEMTEYGNTWVSDYEWGWAPFHYGRWSFDDYLGWFWVPGYDWGPAWVNWRSGGGYYGWAPLGPGIGINVSINIPSFWWIFVPNRHFYTPHWHNYWVPRNRVTRVYNQTTIINNYYRNDNRTYVYGPRREEIERYSRRSIPVREIDMNARGRVIANSNRGDGPATYKSHSRISSGSSRTSNARTSERFDSNRSNNTRTAPNSNSRGSYEPATRSTPNQRSTSEIYSGRENASGSESRTRTAPSTERGTYSAPSNNRSSRENSSTNTQRSVPSSPAPESRSSSSRSSAPTVRSTPSAPTQRSSGSSNSRSSSSSSERSSSQRSSRSGN